MREWRAVYVSCFRRVSSGFDDVGVGSAILRVWEVGDGGCVYVRVKCVGVSVVAWGLLPIAVGSFA